MERKYRLFLLDEDYKDFQPGKTPLKYQTVFDAVISLPKMIAMALVFTGLFACLFADLSPKMQAMNALSERGVVADATVTFCEMKELYRSQKTSLIYYTYQLDETVYKADEQLAAGGGLCDAYPAGTRIRTVYLPEAPTTSQLLLENGINPAYPTFMVLGVGFVGFLMLVNWWLCLDWLRGWLKWRRFNKYAMLLEGKLVDAHFEKRRLSSVWVLRYQYEHPQGVLQTHVYEWHYHGYPRIIPRAEKAVLILYVNETLQLLL
jgi:hypothetical protein